MLQILSKKTFNSCQNTFTMRGKSHEKLIQSFSFHGSQFRHIAILLKSF